MLQADRVTVTFGRRRRPVVALPEVSVALRPGQRLGLTGPSGSGKSTLAQVLALLRAPDRGSVRLDGRPVLGAGLAVPPAVRRRVQLLWQSPRAAVSPRLRLAEVISEPLLAQGEKGAPVGELAAAVGLTPELLPRHPHEVSDGQLQRAALARALVLAPDYLICDEPTTMLDVSTQASLLQVLAEHQSAHGTGVLLVTHDLRLAEHWCDEVVDIRDLAASDPRPGFSPI